MFCRGMQLLLTVEHARIDEDANHFSISLSVGFMALRDEFPNWKSALDVRASRLPYLNQNTVYGWHQRTGFLSSGLDFRNRIWPICGQNFLPQVTGAFVETARNEPGTAHTTRRSEVRMCESRQRGRTTVAHVQEFSSEVRTYYIRVHRCFLIHAAMSSTTYLGMLRGCACAGRSCPARWCDRRCECRTCRHAPPIQTRKKPDRQHVCRQSPARYPR